MPEKVKTARSYTELICPTQKRALEVAQAFGHFLIDHDWHPPKQPSHWFIFTIVKTGKHQWSVQVGNRPAQNHGFYGLSTLDVLAYQWFELAAPDRCRGVA